MSRFHVPIRDSLVVLLTVTTGAVDAASFLALGNVFGSVITGNMVLLGVAAGTGRPELAMPSGVALAGYVAGVAAGASVSAHPDGRGGPRPPRRARHPRARPRVPAGVSPPGVTARG